MASTTTTEQTMTLASFLADYEVCRVWWTSVGSPGGQELVLNEDTEDNEEYCDGEALVAFIPQNSGHLEGTVTRDGEWRWEVDSLQDEDVTDPWANTILNLVVWGEING